MLNGKEYQFEDVNKPLKALKGRILHALKSLPASPMGTFAQVFTVACFCDYKASAKLLRDLPLEQKYIGQAELVCRGMLEVLFNYLYISSSPEERIKSYKYAAWRERKRDYDDLIKFYENEERYKAHIERVAKELKDLAGKVNLPTEYLEDRKRAPKWPTPTEMRREIEDSNKDLGALLNYLDVWIYRPFSRNAHGEYDGLTARWATEHISLRDVVPTSPPEDWIAERSSKVLYRVIEILLMLLSEVCIYFCFRNLLPDCRSLWESLVKQFEEIDELYSIRYKALLE